MSRVDFKEGTVFFFSTVYTMLKVTCLTCREQKEAHALATIKELCLTGLSDTETKELL